MRLSSSTKTALALLLASVTLASCGGSGGLSQESEDYTGPFPKNDPPTTVANANSGVPSEAALKETSRFLSRMTFGMPYQSIIEITKSGKLEWLEDQLEMTPTYHSPHVDKLIALQRAGAYEGSRYEEFFPFVYWRAAWWNRLMTAPDVVWQRVAFALSEIFVVSDIDILVVFPYALPDYYDTLLEGATGNFRDLLYDISVHPSMGIYLSHVNNRKADEANNTFPDENFAREIMQLFSIGLYELNRDGTLKLDSNGNPTPTYDNRDIRDFARVFTGLSYGGPGSYFGRFYPYFEAPMQMYPRFHDTGEKLLLRGQSLPAGQDPMDDVNDAIDNLFNHPNVGPFIGKLLIQRLVTSNPSAAYVERVARAFNGDNGTARGDLKEVLRAVFLDPESEAPNDWTTFGKLREPVVRVAALARQFNFSSRDDEFFNSGFRLEYFVNQHPLASPSVFNFFLPTYSPPGALNTRGLVAPEFQITNSNTIFGITNQVDLGIFVDGGLFENWEPFSLGKLDVSDYAHIADDADELTRRLDIVMTYGRMQPETRGAIIEAISPIQDPVARVQHAIYFTALSPDYAVED